MQAIIQWHQRRYPFMEQTDILKLIFQNEFAGGHLISNIKQAKSNLMQEIKSLEPWPSEHLYEEIGNHYLRIHLRPYVLHKLSLDTLVDAFVKTANQNTGTIASWTQKLDMLGYPQLEATPFHHSEIYRNTYHPSYRVISRDFLSEDMRLIQAKQFIKQLSGFHIIALEGKCGSGKSTLAKRLNRYGYTLLPMDDFFLPFAMRTDERMQEIGGNIHYEYVQTVLESIKPHQTLTYQKFDCATGTFKTKSIQIKEGVLLEGVYSYHPAIRRFITRLMYLEIDEVTQKQRIQLRDHADDFFNRWIPLENRYFNHEQISYQADIII